MGLTTYYSQGTCTIAADDTTVTGQGSSWLGKIWPGDLFGMHAGKLVRIASVDSATQLTLAHPWTGPSQTAAPYEIQNIQRALDVSKTARDLITRLDSGELFGRAAIDTLAVTGGTGDAIVVAPLAALAAGALFMLTAAAANTGATTIQVPGIGTYPVEYADGTGLAAGELQADNQTVLYFDGDRFVVVISSVALSIPAQEQAVIAAASALAAADSVTAAAAQVALAADQVALATAQAGLAASGAELSSDFANAPEDVEVEPGLYSAKHWAAKAEEAGGGGGDVAGDIHAAAAKTALDDDDELGLVDSAASWLLKKVSLTDIIASIFKTTRTIANAQFAADTFRLFNAAGTPRSLKFNIDALTTGRTVTVPDRGISLDDVNPQVGWNQTWQDVSGSRTHSTAYQNTTGRPIAVNIFLQPAPGVYIQTSVNGSTWVNTSLASGSYSTTHAIVIPNGWYFRVNGSASIAHWAELR